MAASVASSRLSPVKFALKPDDNPTNTKSDTSVGEDGDLGSRDILSGALISPKLQFHSKKGGGVSLSPIIVDFRRLLQSKGSVQVVPGVPNRELLHAVVGLYDVSLSEMTPDVLYNTVAEKWARTVILLRDVKDALLEQEKRRERHSEGPQHHSEIEGPQCASHLSLDSLEPSTLSKQKATTPADPPVASDDTVSLEAAISKDIEDAEEKDIFEPEEEKPSVFAEIFSDTEDEEGSESEEEEEDFSKGFKSFMEAVRERKRVVKNHTGPLTQEHIGVENRIVAAMTFEKTYCKPNEKVIHLTLIAVRKKFQKLGLGKYLISQIKDTSVVGPFDAIVVHADNSAVEFFQRYAFSDDIVLNSKWSELAEQFTNCTLMCYMPPFTDQNLTNDSIPELDIIAMEREIQKWREKSMEAYRAEVTCVNRLRHEVIHLRALTCSQQQLIATLATEIEEMRREKFALEKEFLEHRLATATAAFNGITQAEAEDDDDADADDDEDGEEYGKALDSAQLLKELLAEAELKESGGVKPPQIATHGDPTRRYLVSQGSAPDDEPYDHRLAEEYFKVTQDFSQSLKHDPGITHAYDVKMVTKAMLPNSFLEAYQMRLSTLKDPLMVTNLYFCGSLERPENVHSVLHQGFTEHDFSHGDYGRGLYFSKYPSKAAQFSALGKLLIVEVGLGNTQTVVRKDRTRTAVDDGSDSIITPGRLSSSGDNDSLLCQEYVVFDTHQIRPLFLIEYVPSPE